MNNWFLFFRLYVQIALIVNKQINDKERVAAAMENPNLRKIVEECLQEVQY